LAESHNTYFQVVKKKIHALGKISTDLNPSELLGIAHVSIYSVLHYAAGTWLNLDLQEKYNRGPKVLSNSTLQIVFGKRRQECSALENILTHWVFLQKSSGCKISKRSVYPCN
jgi:hypothetical protein